MNLTCCINENDYLLGGNQEMLRVLDPVAETRPAESDLPLRVMESLDKLRVALVWSGHAATVKFWPVLERTVEELFRPREVRRVYKSSTWNVTGPAEIEELARGIDFAIVGVGA